MLTAAPATTIVHLVLDPAPPLREVVRVTDRLRHAALSRIRCPAYPSMLAGYTAPGEPFRDRRHQHAHWLPVAQGSALLGVCVWTPAGLAPAELDALRAVRSITLPGADTPTRVVPLPGPDTLPAALAGPARVWRSLTPFSCPRRADRPSRRTPDHLTGEITRELEYRGLPGPAEVAESSRPVRGWQTRRPSRPVWVPPPRHLRVEFSAPVPGPIALGRLSHFGLGVLIPEEAAC